MSKLKRSATVTALVAACAASSAALAVYEMEGNDSMNTPQRLMVDAGGNAEVTGSIGDPSGTTLVNDVDFYTFEGQQGDVVTIDIDGGIKGSGAGRQVDTYLTLFRPNSTILRENDDAPFPVDAGSLSFRDARIDNIRLPMTGTYTVAVSAWSMAFWDGGLVVPGTRAMSNGSYTLNISGVTPLMQQVNIEIKPGTRGRAPINPKSRGRVPVALLSDPEFNALEVDESSLTFGPTGGEASALRCGKNGSDVNGDGLRDLVCHFDNQEAGFEPGDLEGVVMGRTLTGSQFEGRGTLKVVPVKRK